MKRTIITVAALLGAAVMAAQPASTSGGKIELTLDEAIEIALNDNKTLKIANLEIERQDYVRQETIGNLIPSLSASGQYVYAIKKQEMAPGLSFGADNSITLSGTLSVPLYVPAVYASLRLNRTQMESAVEAARSSKITLVNEVKKSFYMVLLMKQSLDVLHESKATIQKVVDNTRVMYESGLASEYDVLSAEVQLNSLEPTIIQTRGGLDTYLLMLKMHLSIPESVEIDVRGDLDAYASRTVTGGAERTTDISYNSDLRALEIQGQMLKDQLRLINSQRLPTIAAFGQAMFMTDDMGAISFDSMTGDFMAPLMEQFAYIYNVLGQIPGAPPIIPPMTDTGSGSTSTATQEKWRKQYPINVGLQISVPIFSGLKTNKQAKQTRNAIAQLDIQKEYVEEMLTIQSRNAINTLISAYEKMNANRIAAETARKALAIADARFRAGSGTILELNSSQLSLTQAMLNYSQAVYDYMAAEADYDKIMGRDYWGNSQN